MMPQLPLRRRGEAEGARHKLAQKDIVERVRGWAEGEETRVRERKELVGELGAAMQAHGHDPRALKTMGG